MTIDITELAAQSLTIATLTVAAVEAVRRRATIDGWHVLVWAAGASIALTALIVEPHPWTDPSTIPDAVTVAILAWIAAVGGDAWVGKIASKVRRIENMTTGDDKSKGK